MNATCLQMGMYLFVYVHTSKNTGTIIKMTWCILQSVIGPQLPIQLSLPLLYHAPLKNHIPSSPTSLFHEPDQRCKQIHSTVSEQCSLDADPTS